MNELPPGFELDAPSAAALSGVPTPPGVTRITVGGSQSSGMIPQGFELDPPNVWEDMAKSAGIGVPKAVIGIAGLPGNIRQMGEQAASGSIGWIARKLGMPEEQVLQVQKELADSLKKAPSSFPTSAQIQKNVEDYTGEFYKPKTVPGEYAQTATEFSTGALAGPGGPIGNVLRYGLAPGLASEYAGQKLKGTEWEAPARVGTALATGGVAGAFSRPGTAAQAIRAQLPSGITEPMMIQAKGLIDQSAQQGVQLAWPEALSQVAGRPVLTNLMRHLEASPQTEARMAEFFGQRPQQIEAAGRAAMGNFGPAPTNPHMVGPQAGEAAIGVLDQVNAAINKATKPSYDAARQSLVPQSVHAAMMADPLFASALRALRNDVERNVTIRGLSDRNVIVYDAVKQALAERAGNLSNPAQPFHSRTAAANVGSLGGDVKRVAVASDRAAMGLPPGQGVGNLENALAEQARLRQAHLEPLQRGPIGRLADKDATTRQAMEALFPAEPLAGSQQAVYEAVHALVTKNPRVAGELVRVHAETTFNEAMRSVQSMPGAANQMGGAKFAVQLVGNPQQRANFEAAVQALPHGQARLDGFNRFLEVAEATGTRQNVGSRTAYNAEFLKQASRSNLAGEAAKGTTNPFGRGMQFLADKYEQWRLGRNLNELANILTDPAAVNQFRAIARMPPGSAQAQARALRIAMMMQSATLSTKSQPVSQPGQ